MDGRVCGVHKLSGDEAAGNLRSQLLCLRDGTLHALCTFGEDNLCAVCLQNVASLNAHGLGHRKNDAVTLGCCDGCKTDTGVAGRRLDDDAALMQLSLRLGILNHRLRDTILHASCGIEVLKFHQERSLQTKILFDIRNLHKRGVSNQTKCTLINLRHSICPP